MAKKAQQYMTVITHANGKRTETKVPMTPAMQKASSEFGALMREHGCKCKRPHPDHIQIIPRGHSVDVLCSDCGGIRQVG